MLNHEFTPKQIEIMETALKIISSEGVKSASFRLIAKRLGVTEPAIYRHFQSKSQFTVLLYMYMHRSFMISVNNDSDERASFSKRLYSLLNKALFHIRQCGNANFKLLAYSIYKNDRNLQDIITRILLDYSSKIKDILDDAVLRGEINSIDTEAHSGMLSSFTQTYAINSALLKSGIAPSDYLESFFESYINGIKKGDRQ